MSAGGMGGDEWGWTGVGGWDETGFGIPRSVDLESRPYFLGFGIPLIWNPLILSAHRNAGNGKASIPINAKRIAMLII